MSSRTWDIYAENLLLGDPRQVPITELMTTPNLFWRSGTSPAGHEPYDARQDRLTPGQDFELGT